MSSSSRDPDASPPESEMDRELGADVNSDDRTWAVLVHAAAFTGFLVPFGNILGPLIIWSLKKEESAFVNANGKQAVNFQLTWTIYLVLAAISLVILIGFVLLPLVAMVWFVSVVLAIIEAGNDGVYDYPLTVDFVAESSDVR